MLFVSAQLGIFRRLVGGVNAYCYSYIMMCDDYNSARLAEASRIQYEDKAFEFRTSPASDTKSRNKRKRAAPIRLEGKGEVVLSQIRSERIYEIGFQPFLLT